MWATSMIFALISNILLIQYAANRETAIGVKSGLLLRLYRPIIVKPQNLVIVG